MSFLILLILLVLSVILLLTTASPGILEAPQADLDLTGGRIRVMLWAN